VASSSVDFIRIVEAAYTVERTDQAWLTGVLDAVRPALDARRGVVAYFYDASVRPIEPWGFVGDYEMTDAEPRSLRTSSGWHIRPCVCILPVRPKSLVSPRVRPSFGATASI
jgi:hypothetical protein